MQYRNHVAISNHYVHPFYWYYMLTAIYQDNITRLATQVNSRKTPHFFPLYEISEYMCACDLSECLINSHKETK